MDKHIVSADNAAKIWGWLQTRGGIAIWQSINLSNPGASWTTPATHQDGTQVTKPTWQAANTPHRIITDPADVAVSVDKEVTRFHVAVRRSGAMGLTIKVTDGGSRRIRAAVAKAGEGAYHSFDYETQEAIILAPTGPAIPIADFISNQPK